MTWRELLEAKLVSGKLPFFSDCVGWPRQYEDALDSIRRYGTSIVKSEFMRHADAESYKNMFYVGRKLDWHVDFRKYQDVYYFVHSGIEYVFATERQVADIQKATETEV